MAMKDKLSKRIIIHTILIIASILAIYPILRVVTISLRPGDRAFTASLAIIPKDASFDSFKNILFLRGLDPKYASADLITKFFHASFWIWLKNSTIVSFFTVIFGVSFASTAGYAFSRFNFPGKKSGLTFFLITQMFPATMLLLPMYLVMSKLHLTNTYFGLILMYTTTALPLCVWQMKGYYDTIPYTLEEAAMIDGASQFKAFYKIILPLVKPGVVVTALFSFMASWTDFVVANVFMQKESLKTLPLGLQTMAGQFQTEWGNFAAASILVMVPAMALFMYLSKYLISGLTLGGVKE
ncbi:sugar ABC transporter permease [Haliovirga abyssi]|uniref:ABC transporter permease n=1 Tax=Haliovirga abyssi TaxID=2996794 RepID=A0AAU9DHN4_9FUSO|nr:sugar ABC transporter permease [Haliovirga abyssi]BDU51067.1 ABC transporter permease [Haliovirga abyssi]